MFIKKGLPCFGSKSRICYIGVLWRKSDTCMGSIPAADIGRYFIDPFPTTKNCLLEFLSAPLKHLIQFSKLIVPLDLQDIGQLAWSWERWYDNYDRRRKLKTNLILFRPSLLIIWGHIFSVLSAYLYVFLSICLLVVLEFVNFMMFKSKFKVTEVMLKEFRIDHKSWFSANTYILYFAGIEI